MNQKSPQRLTSYALLAVIFCLTPHGWDFFAWNASIGGGLRAIQRQAQVA